MKTTKLDEEKLTLIQLVVPVELENNASLAAFRVSIFLIFFYDNLLRILTSARSLIG